MWFGWRTVTGELGRKGKKNASIQLSAIGIINEDWGMNKKRTLALKAESCLSPRHSSLSPVSSCPFQLKAEG